MTWKQGQLPPKPKTIHRDGEWRVVELPTVTARPRVGIIPPNGLSYAPVWRDGWREALAAAQATGEIPEEHRAPGFGA